jgi:tetratricopeptide (TPR) repeat protein
VLTHVTRAIACGAAGATLGELRLLAAEAHEWRGEFAEAARTAGDALRWLPAGDPRWFAAAGVLAVASGVQGREQDLLEVAARVDEALVAAALDALGDAVALAGARLAEQLIITGHLARADALLVRLDSALVRPGPAAEGRLEAVHALRARYAGDAGGNLAHVEAALVRFAAAGDRRNLCVFRERLGYARHEVGDFAGAEVLLRESIEEARQLGLRNVAATARHNLGLALARLGRCVEGAEIERAAIDEFTATGNRRMRGAALEYLALIQLAAGDAAGAEAAARQAVDVASLAPALPLNQAESWAILGRALLAGGRAADALEMANHAIAALERLGGIDDGEAIIRLTHAEALAAVGDASAARVALRCARARLLERAERIRDDGIRASFLERVPENRRTLELSREVGAL